jgi:hypothetical protein
MTGRGTIHCIIAAAIALLLAGGAYAQSCDDFNECTANDMCSNGECTGSFQDGGCDDNNPCTLNDRCQMDPDSEPFCLGTDPAPVGTECGGGCGTCQPIAPFPGAPVTCSGDPENTNDSCDPGIATPCLEGKCQFTNAGTFFAAFCLPSATECPDTDGNPCTDGCNLETGQCQVNANPCIPNCERCDPGTGQCVPDNVGAACDDFNVCTPQSSCQTMFGRTFCFPGEPTASCVGDCNANGEVAVNEMIIGVNIALGSANISQCPAFDRNSSDAVEVNELIGGVNSLLNGCA